MRDKLLFPYITAAITFFLIAILYSSPVLEGKKVHMGDITKHKAQSKELNDYKTQTGKTALWTNSMFGGMPSYLISAPKAPWLTRNISRILNLNQFRPVSFIFLYMLGFFIAMLCFGVNPWLSIVGAIAYGFSTYFLVLIPAGHASKAITLGYMPAVIGGVHLAFKSKRLLGSIIFGLFFALQLLVNHLQITYYTFIIILVYVISELVIRIKNKELNSFLITSIYLIGFGILAIGCNIRTLWTTYEYGKYSIRGKSELTDNAEDKTSGLDKSYATQWSYGIGETFTLLIPNFYGGASAGELPTDSETYKLLVKYQGKAQAKKLIKQMPTYWGEMIFTAGPVYVGAIICFLFVLGLFILDKPTKRWLLIATIISFILAWGKYIPNITHFLLDYLPLYNKFRTVSTALIIAEFTMPLMAILVVAKIFKGDFNKKDLHKKILYAMGITGGLALFFALFGKSIFSFESPIDQQYIAQGSTQIVDAWKADRAMIFRSDAFRSFFFIALAGSVLLAYINNKLKLKYAIITLGILVLADLWPVNKRYFNNDDFETKKEHKNPYVASVADELILSDTDPHYRVLNLSSSIFQDAGTSYFHKSIGGYHGAKWRRIQELYEYEMVPEMQSVITALKSQDMASINTALKSANVLNMFNIKYIIYNPQAQPLLNNAAAGNAWFVDRYQIVENADEEIATISKLNLMEEVVIDRRFSEFVENQSFIYDSLAVINLTEYKPDYLSYKSSSLHNQLAVFSEVYYPKGWIAKIDGEIQDHFRVNYMLRAMIIPKGEHTIEFSFEPQSYIAGGHIAAASSWILFLSILGSVFILIRKRNKKISEG